MAARRGPSFPWLEWDAYDRNGIQKNNERMHLKGHGTEFRCVDFGSKQQKNFFRRGVFNVLSTESEYFFNPLLIIFISV
jgi:hypothetical protein